MYRRKTLHTRRDGTLAKEIRKWQDKGLQMVYRGPIEPDKTFLKLNLAAVHHERAKTFLQFHKLHPDLGYLKDARNEVKLAWQALTPDLISWKVYFHLTESRIFQAEKEVHGSAQSGLAALKVLRDMQSKWGKTRSARSISI